METDMVSMEAVCVWLFVSVCVWGEGFVYGMGMSVRVRCVRRVRRVSDRETNGQGN